MFGKYFLRVKHMFVDDKIVLMVFAAAGGGGGRFLYAEQLPLYLQDMHVSFAQ